MLKFPVYIIAISVSFAFFGCIKDKDEVSGLKVQAHDQNAMMKLMHNMESKMDTMMKMKNVDHDFAMMMRMHHQGAIDMANEELKSGDNQQIKDMATKIIGAQTAEISELTTFLNTHMDMDTTHYMKYDMEIMSTMEKMSKGADLQVITGDADNDFAALMIIHHQSATDMAHAEIEFGKDADLKKMAEKMIEDQNMEIKEFQEWLLKNKPY